MNYNVILKIIWYLNDLTLINVLLLSQNSPSLLIIHFRLLLREPAALKGTVLQEINIFYKDNFV